MRLQLNYNSKGTLLKSRKNTTLPGKYNCNEGRKTASDMVDKTNTDKVVLKRTVKTKH